MTVSRTGYAKTQPIDDYVAQKRGGKGKSATAMKEDDVIDHLVVTSTHATVLCFTDSGRVFSLRGFEVPLASRGARGRPLVNIIGLDADEVVTAILPVDLSLADDRFVFFATANGTVKRVELAQLANIRSNGLIAIGLEEGDKLVSPASPMASRKSCFLPPGKLFALPRLTLATWDAPQKVRGMRMVKMKPLNPLLSLSLT